MSIILAPQYTQRTYFWSDWKSVFSIKGVDHQYDDDGTVYTIWFYDGPEVHVCTLWKSEIPSGLIASQVYTQEQNDSDVADFESNYLPTANSTLVHKAASGVAGQAPAKGLGGFVPDPRNNNYQPDADEVVGLYVDVYGALTTRGQTFTDEGSFRDDFTGNDLETTLTGTLSFTNGSTEVTGSGTLFTEEVNRANYIKLSSDSYTKYVQVVRAPNNTSILLSEPYDGTTGSGSGVKTSWLKLPGGGTPGTISVSSSSITLSSGTTNGGRIAIYRGGDYLPLVNNWSLSLSQRIADQSSFVGLRDDVANPTMYCDVVFDGTDDTKVKFRSAWNGDEEVSTISLPSGLNTSQSLRYKIDCSIDYAALMINGVLVCRHEAHIPDPYASLHLCAGIENTSTVTNTDLAIDTVLFSNQDQVQITSNFVSPLSVVTKEDQHSIIGKVVTTSTTADQVIVSYTVPNGRVCYLIGYKIDNDGTLNNNTVKIGRNTVTTVPSSPGTVDDNIFRVFTLNSGSSTGEIDFGSNPRKIGVGGDVLKVVVTPSGSLSSTWYAALDFVLR
jgi:hypothetical protein